MKRNGSDQAKFFALHPSAKPVGSDASQNFAWSLPLMLIAFGNFNLCGDFGIGCGFATGSILAMMKSYSSVKMSRDLNFSASVAIERMANEIRLVSDIDDAGSIFSASPGN